MKQWNRRKATVLILVISILFLVTVAAAGSQCSDAARATDFSRKNLLPCLEYPFGTDWMGRDMFARTLKGLSLSILIGVLAAAISAVIALVLGICAATLGRRADGVITWVIDLIMGIPHMLLLILISVAAGRGLKLSLIHI